MAEFPALNLYTDAFLADTSHLDVAESGAYALLLFVAWRIPDGRLPDDDRILARYARCTKTQWKRVKPAVMAFWTREESGTFFQKRLEVERAKARAKSESAKRSANAKHQKNNDTGDANAGANAPETQVRIACESPATTSTSTSTDQEEVVDTPSPVAAREDDVGCDLPAENQDAGAGFVRPPSDHRSGGQRYVGDVLERLLPKTGPPEKRLKRQDVADQHMANWLVTREGKNHEEAWRMVMTARDEDHPEQRDCARYLEKLSRKHTLGWFAEEGVA